MILPALGRGTSARNARVSEGLRRTVCLGLILGFVLVLPGCYGMKILRGPINSHDTQEDIQLVKQRQQEILDRIDMLEKLIADQQMYMRESTAGSHARLDEMLAELEYLRNQTLESTDRMGQYTRRVETATWKSMQPDTLRPKAGAEGDPIIGAMPDEIYDTAYLDVTRGNYSLAVDGFEEYLDSYPNSELADNAQYWIGECYYTQRDYFKAIEEFGKVLDLYPRGDKVPGAMVKLGMSYLEVRDRASAKKIFRQVVELYPHTDEAAIARDQLAMLE
jgi:tol-pal system protein YbgF